MKKLDESLVGFRDTKFFSLFEQEDSEKKLQQKTQQQAAKDAQDIVKKVRDNFARFKSYAGTQIQEYKKFWDMQSLSKKAICKKDVNCKYCYALFNDGNSEKYNPNYVICLRSIEGVFSLMVVKSKLEEGEKNPIFIVKDKQACNDFINFLGELKDELKQVKDHYVKNVESKKKEEEHQQQRQKLDKFLKENKETKIKEAMKEIKEDNFPKKKPDYEKWEGNLLKNDKTNLHVSKEIFNKFKKDGFKISNFENDGFNVENKKQFDIYFKFNGESFDAFVQGYKRDISVPNIGTTYDDLKSFANSINKEWFKEYDPNGDQW